MSVANSKKTAPVNRFRVGRRRARIRRGGGSSRSGRRSALLGVLTSAYANSSRGGSLGRDTRHKRPHLNTTVEYETQTAGLTALSGRPGGSVLSA